jgi:hypothetical protein
MIENCSPATSGDFQRRAARHVGQQQQLLPL